ncbi:unnamed protein product, partial [Symbiodinium necroappetens]
FMWVMPLMQLEVDERLELRFLGPGFGASPRGGWPDGITLRIALLDAQPGLRAQATLACWRNQASHQSSHGRHGQMTLLLC